MNLQTEGIRSFIGLAVVTWVHLSIILIVVFTDRFKLDFYSNRNVNVPISPCGICRQVLREFCSLDMPILLVPGDYPKPHEPDQEGKSGYTEGGVRETTLNELLPDSFGPEHLELPRKSWNISFVCNLLVYKVLSRPFSWLKPNVLIMYKPIIRMIPVYPSGCTSPCIQFYSLGFLQPFTKLCQT